MRGLSWRTLLASVLLVSGVMPTLAACSSSERAVIHVDRPDTFFDVPVAVTVSGLRPNETVVIRAKTRDAKGVTWSSFGTFAADATGRVDLGSAPSSDGTYHGVDAMGIFWSMTPTDSSDVVYQFPAIGEVIAVSVADHGSVVASGTVTRNEKDSDVLGPRAESLTQNGFYGVYDAPADVSSRRPAVLVFGGSEGGLDMTAIAYALASHGYPALAIAYFREPGLPSTLSDIPLEYFARALAWLRAQPTVDPRRLIVYGVSRGSEAALLVGVHYPDLVHSVIALVPSSVAICSFPGCTGPAWTLDGKPLPYSSEFNNPAPADVPAAVIQVESIRGPILLDCGGQDLVWVSCEYADAIIGRLDVHHDAFTHALLRYPDGGHGVGFPLRYVPINDTLQLEGASPEANGRAREQAWPAILDFLANV